MFISVVLTVVEWVPEQHELPVPIYLIAGLIITANMIRLWSMKKMLEIKTFHPTEMLWFKLSCLLTPALLATLLAQVLWHHSTSTETIVLVVMLTAGFGVGATTSLSSSRWVTVIYQLLIQGPILTASLMKVIKEPTGQSMLLAIACFIFFAYTLLQAHLLRSQLIQSFQTYHSLEISKYELELSQRQLQEEHVKVIQSSRQASLGEMAGGIAHEINNPLAVISLSLETLSRQLKKMTQAEDNESLEQIHDKIEKINRSAQRIRKIVTGLRAFSQQGDSLPFELTTVRNVLHDTLEFCQEKMKSKGIDFKILGDLDQDISARPVQISQIILNLLNNAIDAVQATESPKVMVQVGHFNDKVRIEVTDSGPGVPAHVLAKLFQPFVTSKEIGKGTGLGLSVSQGLAKDHKGDLEYLHNEKWTTFRLTLPAAAASEKKRSA